MLQQTYLTKRWLRDLLGEAAYPNAGEQLTHPSAPQLCAVTAMSDSEGEQLLTSCLVRGFPGSLCPDGHPQVLLLPPLPPPGARRLVPCRNDQRTPSQAKGGFTEVRNLLIASPDLLAFCCFH